MSYSILTAVLLAIIGLLGAVCSLISFKTGYEMGVKDYNRSHPDDPKTTPSRKAKTPSSATDKKLREYEAILENIENYDGTDAHQKEIK